MFLMMFSQHLMSLLKANSTSHHIHSCFFFNKGHFVQNMFTCPYTTYLKVNETVGNQPPNFL